MVDVKQELMHRFRESPFYIEKDKKRDVRRYTDKYTIVQKDEFEPRKVNNHDAQPLFAVTYP